MAGPMTPLVPPPQPADPQDEWLRDLREHLTQDQNSPPVPSVGRAMALGAGAGLTGGFLDEIRGMFGAVQKSQGYTPASQAAVSRPARTSGESIHPPTPKDLKAQYPALSYTDAYAQWFKDTRPDVAGAQGAEAARENREFQYHASRDTAREEAAAAAEAHPRAYRVPETLGAMAAIAGGAALAGPTAAEQSLSLADALRTPTTLAQRVAPGIVSAAKVGAALGAGNAPEVTDIPHAAMQGAADSAKMQLAFGLAGPGMQMASGKLASYLSQLQRTKAAERIARMSEPERLAAAEEEIAAVRRSAEGSPILSGERAKQLRVDMLEQRLFGEGPAPLSKPLSWLLQKSSEYRGRQEQRAPITPAAGQVPAPIVATPEEMKRVAEVAKTAGGFTFDPATRRYVTTGYALSTSPDKGTVMPNIGGPSLAGYANRHEPTFRQDPNAVLGGWRNPAAGNWELDVSRVLQSREEAMAQAAAAHQKAIFDLGAGETIPVPAQPGALRAGSEWAAPAPAAFDPAIAARLRGAAVAQVPGGRTSGKKNYVLYDPERDVKPIERHPSLAEARKKNPKFSNGGEVPYMADGGMMMPSHNPNTSPFPQPAPVLPPAVLGASGMAGMGAVDSSALLGQQAAAETRAMFSNPQQSAALTQLYAAAPSEWSTLPPGEVLKRLQAQQAGAQQAGAQQAPPQVDPYAGVLKLMSPPSGAVMAMGKAQQQQFQGEADLAAKQATWSQEQMKWYADARSKIDTDYNATVDDYRNSRIDPNRVFNDRTTGQKALAMVGLLLGGVGAGITGQPNLAANMIQSQIERDIQAQVANMDKKKNLVAMNFERYGNLDAAVRATYMQQTAFYEAKLHSLVATSNAAQAVPQAQIAAYKLREPLIPMMMQLAQYQGLQSMIRSGGHVTGDMPAPWSWDQYMALAMPGPGGRTTFARSPEDRKAAVEKLQKWDSYSDAVDQLDRRRSGLAALSFLPTDAQHEYEQARDNLILQLAGAQGVGKGEAMKLVEKIVPGNVQQFLYSNSLDALRQIGSSGMWSIWETHGSLHNPRLQPMESAGRAASRPEPQIPRMPIQTEMTRVPPRVKGSH